MKTSPKPVASRGRVLLVLVGALACVGLMMIPALLVAHGETASHTKLHLASSAVVMAVATLIALVWRSTRRRSEAIARSALLVTVSLLAASQLAESAGAYAWEADGTTLRSPTLHVVHTV